VGNSSLFVSLQADVEYDKLVPYRGSNPRDALERHKVKVTHTQRARCERERGRFDVTMGVQGAVHVYRRAARTGVARRDGKVFRVGRAPPETMCTFGERCAAQRWLAAVQLGEIPEGTAGKMYGANTTAPKVKK
jgi:hypothetical protein